MNWTDFLMPFMTPPLATGVEIAVVGLSLAAAAASAYMASRAAKKTGESPVPVEDVPSTLATRGDYVPVLVGKRRIGPLIGWVGNRFPTRFETEPGGGGGFGKGAGGGKRKKKAVTWSEQGWHVLCIGPARRINQIWVGGLAILAAPIASDTEPSGTTVTPNHSEVYGDFVVYWGEEDQPVGGEVNEGVSPPLPTGGPPPGALGIASRWPFFCYVFWKSMTLQSNRWPLVEYEVEVEPQVDFATALTAQNAVITVDGLRGANPIFTLAQVMCSPFPHGLSLDPDFDGGEGLLNACSFELLADYFENSEGLPSSSIAKGGQEAIGMIAEIMQDLGLFLSWDPNVGQFDLVKIRLDDSIAVPADLVEDPAPEIEISHWERVVDKLIFSFPDSSNNYKAMTLSIDDDGQASYIEYTKTRQVGLASFVDLAPAQKVAERRSQEEYGNPARYTFHLGRAARLLYPGVSITVVGYTGVFRVVQVGLSIETDKVEVICVSDVYAVEATTYIGPDKDADLGSAVVTQTFPAVADLADTFFEAPVHASRLPGEVVVAVPRLRGDANQAFADLYLSEDGTTYLAIGREFAVQTGGTLLDGLADDGAFEVSQGPTFTIVGPDINGTLDLTSDVPAWRRGRQVALIGSELFFVAKVTLISSTVARLDGLIRARFDTVRATHSIGDTVFLWEEGDLYDIEHSMLQPGSTIYAKAQPGTGTSILPLASVSAVSGTLKGKGIVPMPPSSLRPASAARPNYESGGDIALVWSYSTPELPGTGAGMQRAGDAVGDGPQEGGYELSFYTTGGVLKNTYLSGLPSYTYYNADLISDFGSEQSFDVEVREVNGGYRSDPTPKLRISLV